MLFFHSKFSPRFCADVPWYKINRKKIATLICSARRRTFVLLLPDVHFLLSVYLCETFCRLSVSFFLFCFRLLLSVASVHTEETRQRRKGSPRYIRSEPEPASQNVPLSKASAENLVSTNTGTRNKKENPFSFFRESYKRRRSRKRTSRERENRRRKFYRRHEKKYGHSLRGLSFVSMYASQRHFRFLSEAHALP